MWLTTDRLCLHSTTFPTGLVTENKLIVFTSALFPYLEGELVSGVGSSVDDVEGGHGQDELGVARQVAVVLEQGHLSYKDRERGRGGQAKSGGLRESKGSNV
jgi:hypothetical protein